jgi:hypothetical protein
MHPTDAARKTSGTDLLWAEVSDMRRPEGCSIRGFRLFTHAEIRGTTAFLLEGMHSEGASAIPVTKRFVLAGFAQALDTCMTWSLRSPRLFAWIFNKDYGVQPATAQIAEVHGAAASGPLIVRFVTGQSAVVDPNGRSIPCGPVRKLFPPSEPQA